MEIIFASSNRHKIEEAQKILGPSFRLISPADLGFTGEIPETTGTIPGNSEQKAEFIWNMFHRPCFADDTGLEIDALGGEPGVYSARYAGIPADPARNIIKVLEKMKGVPPAGRTARFLCVVTYIDAAGRKSVFEGVCKGSIAERALAQGGFGYDPVFISQEAGKVLAELSMEEKNAVSHRGKAMRALLCHLSQNQE